MLKFGVLLVVLVGFVGLANSQIICNIDTAANHSVLTSSTGTIPFSVGPRNYQNGQSCSWEIHPARNTTSYTITVPFLSLEYQYDNVRLWAYTINGTKMIKTLTGHTAPPPFEFPTADGRLFVEFLSDYSLNFGGFRLDFEANHCNETCNNGYCLNDVCVCNEGFSGSNCGITNCGLNDTCSGHGTCINGTDVNTCECQAGFFGWDCSKRSAVYCNGTTEITSTSGRIYDHHQHDDWTASAYRKPTRCVWNINTNASGSTTVWSNKGQVESPDSLRLSWGSQEIDYATGGFPLPPVIIDNQIFQVDFQTSTFNPQTWEGFDLQWTLNTMCPNECSGTGHCIDGTCACFGGYTGADCSSQAPFEPLLTGLNMSATLNKYEWKYYRGNLPKSKIVVRISLEDVLNPYPYYPGPYLGFLLASDRVPTQNDFDLALDFPIDTAYVITGVSSGSWTFAIWGLEASKYKFELEVTPAANQPESTPRSDDGGKDESVVAREKKERDGWIAAAVLVPAGVVTITIVIVAVILLNKRRNARKFQYMNDQQ